MLTVKWSHLHWDLWKPDLIYWFRCLHMGWVGVVGYSGSLNEHMSTYSLLSSLRWIKAHGGNLINNFRFLMNILSRLQQQQQFLPVDVCESCPRSPHLQILRSSCWRASNSQKSFCSGLQCVLGFTYPLSTPDPGESAQSASKPTSDHTGQCR